MRFWRRKPPATLARVDRDAWVEWMRLGGQRDSTVDGYRRTTEILLTRYPTLAFADITDEHIQGIVEEARPASRQTRRAAFTNWFGWGFRSKRITFNPMHHVPTYKQPPQAPVTIFNELEQKLLCALPDPDGTLMALLLGSGLRRSEASNLTVARVDLDHAERDRRCKLSSVVEAVRHGGGCRVSEAAHDAAHVRDGVASPRTSDRRRRVPARPR